MGAFALARQSPAVSSGATGLAGLPRLPIAPTQEDRTGSGLFGFLGNFGGDVVDLVGGVAGLIGTGASEIWNQPTNVLKEFATLGFADTPVNVMTPAIVPALGEALVSDVKDRYLEGDIAEELYDHPLSFLLDATAIAGLAGTGARVATGTGKLYGGLGRALIPAKTVKKNAELLQFAREARIARASEGVETLADTVRAFDALPTGERRRAQWLDRLVVEPMRVADPTSGYTFAVQPTRNPLIRAAWTDPIRRKYFLDGVGDFEKQVDELRAVADDLPLGEQRRLASMEAALERMKVGRPEKGIGPAQYVAGKKYGTILARSALKRGAQEVISQMKQRGIITRQEALGDLTEILKRSGVSPEALNELHLTIEGLDDGRIVSMSQEVLETQLRDKGFEGIGEAAEAMIHQSGRHTELDVDERNSLTAMLRDGKIQWEGLWRYLPDDDLAALPNRARFEGELRGALEQTGMPRTQQDLAMMVHDAVSRRAAAESFGGDVDAYYATKHAEFADEWQQGVRTELFQRMNKTLRGVVRRRGGREYLDVQRLARFAENASPDERHWYQNARGFIADVTHGGRHRLPDGRIVRDSELFADILAVTSIGLTPAQQLPMAMQLYMMVKDGSYEPSVLRDRNGRAVEIVNPLLEGPDRLTRGRVGPNVARMVDEIAHGHLIRDWEAEIVANGGDVVMDDLLDMTRRNAPLEGDDRLKVRAYAARLKGYDPDDLAVIDRRIGMFFGVFTGQAVWEAVTGEIRPTGRGYDIANKIHGARYRKLSGYVTEVRDYMNANLMPDEVPYQLEEVQSILWAHTRDFLEDEASRVRKLIRRKRKRTQERDDLERYLDFVTGSMTERMDSTNYAQAWTELKKSRYGQKIASNLAEMLSNPKELAQKIQADIKGSMIFGPNFSKLVRFYKTGDFTTVIHELGHEIRRTLPRQMSSQLHGIYFTRAHGVSDPSDVFEEAGEELFQVGDRLPVELDQETAGKANEIAFIGPDGERYEQADGWVPRDSGYQNKWQRVYRRPDGKLYEHSTSGPGRTGQQMVELDPADVLTHEQAWEQELGKLEVRDPQARRVIEVARSTGGAPMRIREGTVFETVSENDTHYLLRMSIPTTADDMGKFDWYAVPREGGEVAEFKFLGSGKGRPTSEIRLRLPEATKWRKYGTAGVAKKLETLPSKVGDGYAQVRRPDGELLTEGQWVMVKGTPARIAKLSESPRKKQAVYTATVEVLGGELRMTDGGVKPSTRIVPIEDLEVRGDLAAANYGLSEPIGFTEKGQIGTNYGKWNNLEVGDRVTIADQLEQIEQIRAVPYIENGEVKRLNVAVSTRPVRRRDVPDYKNPAIKTIVYDKYSQPAWHRGDEVEPAEPPLPSAIAAAEIKEAVKADPNAERGKGAEGIRRVIAGRDEIVQTAESGDEVLDILEQRFRPEPGAVVFDAYHPMFKAAQDEGIHVAEANYEVPDLRVGTRVAIQGQPADTAEIGVVVEMSPKDIRFGNDITKAKAAGLEPGWQEGRALPLAWKHGDLWVAVEGNHRVWRARQLGRAKMKVVAFKGDLLKDSVGGPLRDAAEADAMVRAYEPVRAGKKGGSKEHAAWLEARTDEALAGVAAKAQPHPLTDEPLDAHVARLWVSEAASGGQERLAGHLAEDHQIPGAYVEAVNGYGPYNDIHAKAHGFEGRADAIGASIERKLDQEDVRAELEEYDELGEEVVPGEQAAWPPPELVARSQTPEVLADVEKYGATFADVDKSIRLFSKLGEPGGNWKEWVEPRSLAYHARQEAARPPRTAEDIAASEAAFRGVAEQGRRATEEFRAGRDVQAESRLSDEAEAAAQEDFAARYAVEPEVEIGGQYEVTVGDHTREVNITGVNPDGGWDGVFVHNGRPTRIRTSKRLVRKLRGNRINEMSDAEVEAEVAAIPPNMRARLEADVAARETPGPTVPGEGVAGDVPAVVPAAAAAGAPPPPAIGGGPPALPPWQPWTREMEEAFAEDLERWFYDKIDPPDPRALGAFRTVADGLVQMWRRVRGFVREHEMVPEEAAKVFDSYLGKMFADIDSPVPTPIHTSPRRMRQIPEAGNLGDRFPDGRQVRQPTVTYLDEATGEEKRRRMNAEELRQQAVGAAANLGRALRPLFGKRVRVALKDARKIRQSHQDGGRVLDASRARVTVDNWQALDRTVDEIAAATDVVGVEDTRRVPGMGGARGVRVYVRDESGFISEVEVGTELWGRFRDSTHAHDRLLTQIVREVQREEQALARAGMSTDPRAMASVADHEKALEYAKARMTAMDRYMQGSYEMIADELSMHHGKAVPGGNERRLVNDFRLWVMRHLETEEIEDQWFDPIYAFERQFLPLRIRSGAEWHEGETLSDGDWYAGDSAYKIDDERAAAGLPMPTYYPHMESPGSPTDIAQASTIQQRGHGAKKMAQNKNQRRNRGILFQQGTYITDVKQAYSLRAARGVKMRDTYGMVAEMSKRFGRAIADPKDLAPGEVVFAPEFLQAFVKTAIGIEDRMGALLSKMDDSELVGAVSELNAKTGREMAADIIADGIRSALSIEEREAGALYRAVSEVIPAVQKQLLMVSKQGLELYALPRHVAQQLYEASKYTFGPGVRIAWDKPTQFWRAVTLYGGTRWVVNNTVGNLGFSAIGGVKIREIVHAAVDKDYRWYVRQLADIYGEGNVDIGFGKTVDYPVNLGTAEETIAGRAEMALESKFRDSRFSAFPRKWAEGVKWLNTHVENHFRRVGFVEGLRQVDAKRNLQGAGRSFWGSKTELEKMLVDGFDPGTSAKAMDRMQEWFGDYQTMTPFERGVLRRFIFPFWGFYRHMLKLTVKMPFDYPAKTQVMHAMSLVQRDLQEEFGPVPTWMDGMVPFGAETPGGKQRFLSVAGPNPFNVFMDTGLGLFHPITKSVFEQMTGRDAYTGREFSDPDVFTPFGSQDRYKIIRGPGGVPIDAVPVEKVVPSLAVSLLSQIPQYDMAKQLVAGGRPYDTSGLIESIGNPVTDESGQPIAPYGPATAASRLLGASTYDYDIAAYRERLARERENALMEAYERWAETNVGSPVGVG